MEKILRILIVEDLESDSDIVKMIIARDGIKFVDRIVETKEDFVNALTEFSPDLILSDYSLPQFTGMHALLLRQELAPDTPFVLVTGSQNEDVAVGCMKAGADDYILKQNLIRLIPAIKAAMQKQETKRLRREAENALRVSEAGLKEAQRVGRLGSWDWDAEHDIIHWSDEYYRVYGFDPGFAPVGYKEHLEAYSPESAALLDAAVQKALQTGIGYQLDLIQVRPDGTNHWIAVDGEVKRNEKGLITGLRGTAQDITARKQAEEEIRESEAHLNLALQSARMSIWRLEILEDRRYFDDQACFLMGLNPANFKGTSEEFFGVIHPDDQQTIKMALKDAVEKDVLYEVEYRVVWPDESVHYISARGRILRNDKGAAIRLNGVVWDVTQRKESEEALLKLKKAVDNSGEIIFMTDRNGIFSFINPAFTAIYGFTPDEIIGKASPRILKSGTMTLDDYKLFWETLINGKEVRGELINKKKDGTLIYIESTSNPIFDEYKNIIGFLCIQQDITERKRTEAAIRNEHILLRTLIDNLPDTIYAKDTEGRKILANLADLAACGDVLESGIIGKTDLEIYPGEVGEHGYKEDMDILNTGVPVLQREEVYIDSSGNPHWLLTSKLPLFDQQGKVTGLVGIGHNITERKSSEAELRKLSSAVEQNPVAIMITDVEGTIEYINPRFTDLTGFTREEILGQNPRMLKSGYTSSEQYKQLWDTITSGGEWHSELQNKKKNGEYYYESVLISPISDDKGQVTHFLASMEDISDRKRAEDEIRQKVEELAISNEELTRFNRLAIGREMRMIEIKKQCNQLAIQLGKEQPYPLAFL